MRGCCRATSNVKRNSGSGSITLVRSAPPAAMTPLEDHCCQMNVSTASLSSCLNFSSDSFMTDSIQDLPECGLKLRADGPSKQPGDSGIDLDFSWLQVHQIAQVPRSLLGIHRGEDFEMDLIETTDEVHGQTRAVRFLFQPGRESCRQAKFQHPTWTEI